MITYMKRFGLIIIPTFLLLGIAQPGSCEQGVECGDRICATDQYCQVTYPGVYGAPTTYQCSNAPDQCLPDDLTCDCLVASDACPASYAWCDDSGSGPVCSIALP